MIGNDMPPLQCEGQLYNNLQYTLQYEPKHLPGCRRLWVLNNIVNSTVEKMTLELLLNNGYTMDDILVFRINYTRLASLPEHAWLDAVTELNEVRNHMIEHGIAHGARWVLPLDGNHFFTAEMWGFILAAASRHEAAGKKNLKIPVAKVDGPQSPVWLNGSTLYRDLQPHAPLQWEGHLGFRNDSPHRFHPGLGYGRRCKLEAMDRICGTGLYYEWHEAFRYLGLLELYHPDFTPLRANTGECGCMWEVGRDYRTRPMKESLARACGMSVRLWYFPCDGRGEHGGAVTRNESYAFSLRYTARSILRGKIRAMIEATKAGKRR
ncbi:unnamed protein product [Closterium sp. NIES-64]|nr:unnamed protein product [Closterium sp. NIES-64]